MGDCTRAHDVGDLPGNGELETQIGGHTGGFVVCGYDGLHSVVDPDAGVGVEEEQ